MKKRLLSLFMALVMTTSLASPTALADPEDVTEAVPVPLQAAEPEATPAPEPEPTEAPAPEQAGPASETDTGKEPETAVFEPESDPVPEEDTDAVTTAEDSYEAKTLLAGETVYVYIGKTTSDIKITSAKQELTFDDDGKITYSESDGTLTLYNVNLTNTLSIQTADVKKLVLVGKNTITMSSGMCLYAPGDLTISGTDADSLIVKTNYDGAVNVQKTLTITGGTIEVENAGTGDGCYAIRGGEGVAITGGTVTAKAGTRAFAGNGTLSTTGMRIMDMSKSEVVSGDIALFTNKLTYLRVYKYERVELKYVQINGEYIQPGDPNAYGVTLDESGNTLTLGNKTINQTITIEKDMTLELDGDYRINVSSGSCIDAKGNLTIEGKGTLTAETTKAYATAINSSGKITINSGTVTAVNTSGKASSYGINCANLTVNGGTVTAKAEGKGTTVEQGGSGINITEGGVFEVTGGTVAATGKYGLTEKCEIKITGANTTDVTLSGTDSATNAIQNKISIAGQMEYGDSAENKTITKETSNLSSAKYVHVETVRLSDCTVTFAPATYNGKDQTPVVTVKLGSNTLAREDYYFNSAERIDAKTYEVQVNGRGRYVGSVTGTFTIKPKELTAENITLSQTSYTYDGKEKTPTVTVKGVNDQKLTENVDYTVTYKDNVDAGTATVTVKEIKSGDGKNANFTVSGEKTFTIAPKALTADNITLSQDSYTYDGTAKKPAVTVSTGVEGQTVKEGIDYTVTYEKNENAGPAKVKVEAIESGDGKNANFTVSGEKNFTIAKASITPAVSVKDWTYGEAPNNPVVTGNPGSGEETFAYAKDGETVERPTEAGTYTVTATVPESDNYLGGTATGAFTIHKAACRVAVEALDTTYGETGVRLEVTNPDNAGLTFSSDRPAVAAVDAEGNITPAGAGTATVTVTAAATANHEGKTLTVKVEVARRAGSLQVTGLTAEARYGDVITLEATPDEGSAVTSYESDNTDVLTVSGGVVRAVGVGTATVTVKASGSANHTEGVWSLRVEVKPKEITVRANDLEKVYGEDVPALTYTVSPGLAEGDGLEGVTLSCAAAAASDAGVYAITAAHDGTKDKNYSVTVQNGTLTVKAKAVSAVSVSPESYIYDGSEKRPDVTVWDGDTEVPASEYTAAYAGNVNAGMARVTVEDVSGGNYTVSGSAAFEIRKGSAAAAVGTVSDRTYGGDDFPLTVTNATGAYTFSSGDPSVVTVDRVSGLVHIVGAGKTDIILTLEESDNYFGGTVRTPVHIAKRALTVTVDDKEMVYGTEEPTLTGTASGLVENDGASVVFTRAEGDNVGEYAITPAVVPASAADNYSIPSDAVGVLRITPQTVVSVKLGQTSYIYTGTAKNPDVTVWDGDREVSASEYAVAYLDNINAGPARVTVSDKQGGNYAIPAGTGADFTIERAPIEPVVSLAGWVYGQTPSKPSVTGNPGDGEVTYSYAPKGTADFSADAPDAAGEYTVRAVIAETDNYEGATVTADFTVELAQASLTVGDVPAKTYGDEAFRLEIEKVTDGAQTYTSSDERVVTVDKTGLVTVTGAGTATVTVASAESRRYRGVTETVEVTVAPRAVTVTADSKAKTYLDDDPILTYTASGLVGKDTLDVTLTRAAGENAGTYTITPAVKENKNYTVTTKDGTLTVSPRQADTVVTDKAALIYDGTAKEPAVTVWAGGNVVPAEEYTVKYSDNVDAGTGTVTVTDAPGGNYVVSGSGSFVIQKADIAPAVSLTGWTYGEKANTPAVTGNAGNGAVTYTYAARGGAAYVGTVPEAAGEYTVRAEIGETDNHNGKTVTADFTVAKADAGLSVRAVAEDAETFRLEVTKRTAADPVFTSSDEGVMTVDANGLVTVVGAGRAEITVSVPETENYLGGVDKLTLTAEKKDGVLQVATQHYDVTYGDAPFRIADITYEGESDVTFAVSDPAVVAVDADGTVRIVGVGTAEITLTLPESRHYRAVTDSVTVTVAPRAITVAADNKTKTYGEADPAFTAAVTGLAGGDAPDITFTRAPGEDAGAYAITPAVENKNYTVTAVPGTLTVEPKKAGTVQLEAAEFVYDGRAKTPAVTVMDGEKTVPESEYTVSYANNIHAGMATVTVTDKPGGNYVVSGSHSFAIAKADIAPTVSIRGWTYGESPNAPGVTGNSGGGAVTYAYAARNSGDFTETVPTDAGTYTVRATVAASVDYNGGTAMTAFVIAKAAAGLAVSTVADKTHRDAAFQLEVVKDTDAAAAYESSDESVLTVDGNGVVTLVGAGDSTVTVSVPETGNYLPDSRKITITVQKKESVLIVTKESYAVTYGDAPFRIADVQVEGESELQYKNSDPAVVSVDETGLVAILGAGKSTVTLTLPESANYFAATDTVELVVSRKAVTVTARDAAKTYGDDDPAFASETEGLVGKDALELTYDRAAGEDVGEYAVTPAAKENKNYTVTAIPGTLTIVPRVPETVGVTLEEGPWVYNGAAQTPAVTVTADGRTVPESEYAAAYADNVNAGTASVTVTDAEGGNYILPEAGADFTIEKASIAPAVTLTGWTYGESPNAPALTGNDGSGAAAYAYAPKGGAFTAAVPADAGDYTVRAEIAETANYLGGTAQADFSIEKASIDPAVTLTGWTYGESPNAPALTGNDGSGAVTYTYAPKGGAFTAAVPADAGEYTVRAEIAETANHLGGTAQAAFTVAKAAIDPAVSIDGWTYGEAANEPAVTGNIGSGAVKYTYAEKGGRFRSAAPSNAGDYTVRAEIGETPNYLGGTAQADFTVAPRSIAGAQIELGGALIYNGRSQKQKVQSVTLDGERITFEVTGNEAAEPGAYTLTITGTENYTGSVTHSFVIAPTDASQLGRTADGGIAIGGGSFGLQISRGANAPAAAIRTDRAVIVDMLLRSGDLTAEELSRIADGAAAEVILVVSDASSALPADTAARLAAAADGYTVGRYVDMTLYKQLWTGGQPGPMEPLTETGESLSIALTVPTELLNTAEGVTRTFRILREHDGRVSELPAFFDGETNELVFMSDRFSVYAIAYADSVTEPAPGSSDSAPAGPGPRNTATLKSPPAGDDTALGAYIALMAVCVCGLAAVYFKKRRKKTC